MVEFTEEALRSDGFERVYVELDWYDGPRAGLADVEGVVHYFRAVHDYNHGDEADDDYYVWSASGDVVALEREQWAIFVGWNARYEAGVASVESHPGHGGIDARYDELEALLAPYRVMPGDARRVTAEWRSGDRAGRYRADGLGYWVRWHSR